MLRTPKLRFLGVCVIALVLTGCTGIDREHRNDQARKFAETMAETTRTELPPGTTVDLQRCIRLAWKYNLDLELTRMNKRLSELDRDVAFGMFLPQLDFNLTRSGTDHLHEIETEGGYVSMSDKHISRASFSLQQGVFVPQAWHVYQMQKAGVSVQDLLQERLRQLIALQVTARYLGCLTLASQEQSLQRDIREAQEILRETKELAAEGMVVTSKVKSVEVLLLSRRTALDSNRRSQSKARSELLSAMGLSPLADVRLKPVSLPAREREKLPELVTEALLQRPELHISDRNVEIRKQDVKRAVAAFLPILGVKGGWARSSDSFLHFPTVWSCDIIALMTVFDGFRNVAEYKAAKVRRQAAFVKREQQCKVIMMEVVSAYRATQDAAAGKKVAAAALAAAEQKLKEQQALEREGMLTESQLLKALSARDRAAAQFQIADFHHLLARVALDDVAGRTESRDERTKDHPNAQ